MMVRGCPRKPGTPNWYRPGRSRLSPGLRLLGVQVGLLAHATGTAPEPELRLSSRLFGWTSFHLILYQKNVMSMSH